MNPSAARQSRMAIILFAAGFLLFVGGYLVGKDLAERDAAGAAGLDPTTSAQASA